MEFPLTVSEADYCAMRWRLARRFFGHTLVVNWYRVLGGAALLVMVARETPLRAHAGLSLALVAGLLLTELPLMRRRFCQECRRGDIRDFMAIVDERGFTLRRGEVQDTLPWSLVVRVEELDRIVLLTERAPYAVSAIPKADLDAAGIDQLREPLGMYAGKPLPERAGNE